MDDRSAHELIRVLIVDDHRLFADSLKLMLDRDPTLEVVGVAASASEAVDLAVMHDAQVVLMDIGLPDADGYEAARRVLAIKKAARIIALTGRAADEVIGPARDAGMAFYLSKDHIHETIRDAIDRAVALNDARP